MATIRLPWFSHRRETTTKDSPDYIDSDRARDFVRNAYTAQGGATADLKRVYESYLDNERKRKGEG